MKNINKEIKKYLENKVYGKLGNDKIVFFGRTDRNCKDEEIDGKYYLSIEGEYENIYVEFEKVLGVLPQGGKLYKYNNDYFNDYEKIETYGKFFVKMKDLKMKSMNCVNCKNDLKSDEEVFWFLKGEKVIGNCCIRETYNHHKKELIYDEELRFKIKLAVERMDK